MLLRPAYHHHLLRFLVTLDRNKKNCSIQNNVSLNNIVIYSKETVIMLDKVGVYLKAMVEEKTKQEKFTTKNYFNDNYNYSIVEEVLKH